MDMSDTFELQEPRTRTLAKASAYLPSYPSPEEMATPATPVFSVPVQVPPRALFYSMIAERFSCRIYGVLRRGDEVLMTRSRFVKREFVNFPGGGIELRESPIAALKREYMEETGLIVRPVRILYASEGCHESTQLPIQIVSMYWLVEATGGTLRNGGNGDDVLGLFWAPVVHIPTEEMFPADLEFAARLPDLLK